MLTFTDDEFRGDPRGRDRDQPDWAAEAFPDLDDDVRQSIAGIARALRPAKDEVRGFVFDVATGKLNEVS